MDLEITPVLEADFEKLAEMYHRAVGEEGCTWDSDYPSEKLLREDMERGALFCAREAGEVIAAFAIDDDEQTDALECWSPELIPSGEIARLVVRREHQNHGIAGKLLWFAMEELRRRGCRGIHFLVSPGNKRALRAYARLGFAKVGETKMYGHHWFCYEKDLKDLDTAKIKENV